MFEKSAIEANHCLEVVMVEQLPGIGQRYDRNAAQRLRQGAHVSGGVYEILRTVKKDRTAARCRETAPVG